MFKRKKPGEEETEDTQENPEDLYRAQSGGRTDDLLGFGNDPVYRNQRKDDSDIENPIYGNKTPWDMRLAFATSYRNNNRQNEFATASLMFSGNLELTPRWSVRFSSGYDFVNQGFALTQFNFTRNLKSFDLRFDWVPFGPNQRWFFFIGISSSILQDLKWENRSQRRLGRR